MPLTDEKRRFGLRSGEDRDVPEDAKTGVRKERTAVRDAEPRTGGSGRKRGKSAPADRLTEVCRGIEKTFGNPQAVTISERDYETVFGFLLDNHRYDTAGALFETTPDHLASISADMMLGHTERLLEADDLTHLKGMYANGRLSANMLRQERDIAPCIAIHLERRCGDVDAVAREGEVLRSVFPGDSLYAGGITRAVVARASELGVESLSGCHTFPKLNSEYERYREAVPEILSSESFRECYNSRFAEMISGVDEIEDLRPMEKVVDAPGRDGFLKEADDMLRGRMSELVGGYMLSSDSIMELNRGFDRANMEIRETRSEDYYGSVLRLIRAAGTPAGVRECYDGMKVEYLRGKAEWMDNIVDTVAGRYMEMLVDRDDREIRELGTDVPLGDRIITQALAVKAMAAVEGGRMSPRARYAWLEYFSRVSDRELDEVQTVRSRLCLEIGKSLIESDPDGALTYFRQATREDLGGLPVFTILVKAENSYRQGDPASALAYATSAEEQDPSMSCAGAAMAALVANSGDSPSPEHFTKAYNEFLNQFPGLDPVLTKSAMDNLVRAQLAGNLALPDYMWSTIDGAGCPKTPLFAAFRLCDRAVRLFLEEDYAGADMLFVQSFEADQEGRLAGIVTAGHLACRWSLGGGEQTAGSVKTACEEALEGLPGPYTQRYESWFCNLVAGTVEEREMMSSMALERYAAAMSFTGEGLELRKRAARMCIRMGEYTDARDWLEDGDTESRLLLLLTDVLSDRKRIRSEINRISPETPYGRALKDYVEGRSDYALDVWAEAVDRFRDGVMELSSSTRRRDVLLSADLSIWRALATVAVRKEDSAAYANQYLEEAITLLDDNDDGTREFADMRSRALNAKASVRESRGRTVQSSAAQELFCTCKFPGLEVVIAGGPIGTGGAYKVYRGRGQDNRQYAVRIPKEADPYTRKTLYISAERLARMTREEEVWAEVSERCPGSVVRLIETSSSPFPQQLEEYADNDFERAEGSMTRSQRVSVIAEMLDRLQDIHDAGFVHNDIKPENLLMVNGSWKISDFDLAFEEGSPVENTNATFEYMSPEQFRFSDVTSKSDVWAAGVMLYHALTDRYPFSGSSEEYRANVLECRYNGGSLSPRYQPLFGRVFSPDPASRPTAGEFAAELRNING